MLGLVARMIYRDVDTVALDRSLSALDQRLEKIERRFPPSPYFAGDRFGLVDAVFATLFRYFPVLGTVSPLSPTDRLGPALVSWWDRIRIRPSVAAAVPDSYEAELRHLIAAEETAAGRAVRGGPAWGAMGPAARREP